MAGSDLPRRLAVAGVGIPFGVAVIYLGAWVLAALLSIVAALGAREAYLLAEGAGVRPLHMIGMAASALLVLSASWAETFSDWSTLAIIIVIVLTLAALVTAVFSRGIEEAPLGTVAITVFGAIYVGGTLSFAIHLRSFPGVADGSMGWAGAIVVIFPLFITWIGDSVAYFAGRRWGRVKLVPKVSPGKTIAGAVGGLLGTLGASLLFAAILINPYSGAMLSWIAAAGIGMVVACIAQVGDLAESLLKREAGVKDSGSLLPGHGGVLDRFDSVLFALPVTYTLLLFTLVR